MLQCFPQSQTRLWSEMKLTLMIVVFLPLALSRPQYVSFDGPRTGSVWPPYEGAGEGGFWQKHAQKHAQKVAQKHQIDLTEANPDESKVAVKKDVANVEKDVDVEAPTKQLKQNDVPIVVDESPFYIPSKTKYQYYKKSKIN